jgi:hypothetical protein
VSVSEKKAFSEPETRAENIKSSRIMINPAKIPKVKVLMIAIEINAAIIKTKE